MGMFQAGVALVAWLDRSRFNPGTGMFLGLGFHLSGLCVQNVLYCFSVFAAEHHQGSGVPGAEKLFVAVLVDYFSRTPQGWIWLFVGLRNFQLFGLVYVHKYVLRAGNPVASNK